MVGAALDLWENQRGVSNVFLTYFDFFSEGGGQYILGGVERHQRGVEPPTPTNRAPGRRHFS